VARASGEAARSGMMCARRHARRGNGMNKRQLHEALAALEREGTIDAGQRSAILARVEASGDAAGRFATIVGALGGLLVGAGVLSLVAYNWEQLGRPAKLLLILAIFLGLHLAGYRLAESPGRAPRTGRALTVAAVLAFGGAIFLVAQIYHLDAKYPNAVLLWWLLNVPLVLLTSSTALLHVVMALGVLWACWHTGVVVDDVPQSWEHWTAAFGVLLAGLGALLLALGALAGRSRWAHFERHLEHAGLLLALAAPLIMSFDERSSYGEPEPTPLVVLLPGACALVAAMLVAARVRLLEPRRRGALLAIAGACGLALLLGLAAWRLPEMAFVPANLLMLAAIVGVIALGVRRHRNGWINVAVLAFVALLFCRYGEYLWDRLEGGAAFLLTGLLLLGIGFATERGRKRLIARARAGGPGQGGPATGAAPSAAPSAGEARP